MAVSTPIRSHPPSFKELLEQDENSIMNLSMDNQLLYDAENPFNLPANIFCNIFRLTKDMVRHIIDIIRIRDTTPDYSGVPIERQVLITLLMYANGEYQHWESGPDASPSNTNSILKRVTMAVSNHMLHWIKFPVSSSERDEAKKAFSTSENPFPNAFGVMDGFHVRISSPSMQAESFWSNSNRFHSLNVQLICGPDLKVLYVNPRFPGASHDNIIWQASSAHRNMSSAYNEGERDTWLLGDGNYALQPWLMTPVPPSHLDPDSPEERYNAAHTKALGIVDKCVRALRGTWRILSLSKAIDQDPVTVANIVNVCCVLHNMRCAANAPPILEAPKKKYTPRRKRRHETPEGNLPFNPSDSSFGGNGADFDPEERLRVEAARLEAQLATMQANQAQEPPRKVLGNQAVTQNILANQAAQGNVILSDENVGGRKNELALARRIQTRVITEHFTE